MYVLVLDCRDDGELLANEFDSSLCDEVLSYADKANACWLCPSSESIKSVIPDRARF